MQALVNNFSIIMIAGVIGVVAISQVNRLVGSILGVIFWIALAAIGTAVYEGGGALGIASFRFTLPMFYGLCALLVAGNVAAGAAALKRRAARSED